MKQNTSNEESPLQYVIYTFGNRKHVAEKLLDSDPNGVLPENAIVWRQLKELRKKNVNWSVIS